MSGYIQIYILKHTSQSIVVQCIGGKIITMTTKSIEKDEIVYIID